MLYLVLGGARSGKTAVAERLAEDTGRQIVFIATAQPRDQEFEARVAAHRGRRNAAWSTVEEPLQVPEVIRAHPDETLIVDCLGMFVTNLLLLPSDVKDVLLRVEELARAARGHPGLVIVVSNEVGQGVVPAFPLGRTFRDALGTANQIVACNASRVLYTVAGIALDLRAIAASCGGVLVDGREP